MLIPLGTASIRTRPPWATLALIVANVLVYLLTHPVMEAEEQRFDAKAARLARLEAEVEMRHLGEEALKVPAWLRAMGKQTDAQREFWLSWSRGEVPDADPEQVAEWSALRGELAALDRDRFDRRWGFWFRNPNPMSLLTSMFLHADLWHLLGNMLFLWVVGANVEEVWGRRTFLLIYALGGVAAALAQGLAEQASSVPAIGASGAVAGVMGAFAIRHFHVKIRFFLLMGYVGRVSVKAGYVLPVWFADQLRSALSKAPGEGGVAFWAHVGGFVAGALAALAIKRYRVEETVLAPELARQDRARRKAAALLDLERATAHGTAKETLSALDAAAEADPDDLPLRRQRLRTRALSGDPAQAVAEARELLRRTWVSGDRAGYLETWRVLDGVGGVLRPTHEETLRAAMALQPQDPQQAAELLHRVLSEAPPEDPVVPQALQRYAALLDRLGAPELAADVRRRLQALRGGPTA